MAEQEGAPSLGGFEALSNMLVGKEPGEDGRTNLQQSDPPIIEPEELKKKLSEEEGEEKEEKVEREEVEDVEEEEQEEETVEEEELSGLGEFDQDITSYFTSKISSEFGWNLGEEDSPKSAEELVDFIKAYVEENSTPNYANEEVAKFDEYVRNGGSLKNFYTQTIENRVDVDSVDIENEYDQKRVIRENYINQGYSEERISKMIKRYEDAGVLEDEASDALELLKEYNEKIQQKLLEDQKNYAEQVKEEQQKFITAVEENIKTLDNVRGINISQKEKQELLEYILVADKDGLTQYQKDYMKDIKNLLESAYFTKKGDALLNKIKKKGESDAVKTLHEKLKANKGNKSRKGGDANSGSTSSGLSLLGSMLQGS